MNYFLELPKFCTAFAQGDVVQIDSQGYNFLCRVLRSPFVVVARFGHFVSLRSPLSSGEEVVEFAGFNAQKVALAGSASVTVQDFTDFSLYEKLLPGCPVADGCVLNCGLRAVRVRVESACQGATLLYEFKRGVVPLETIQVTSFMEERLALVLQRLERSNLLITGPSGCGKTTLLVEAAASLQIPFLVVKDFAYLANLRNYDGLLIFRAIDLVAPQRSDFASKEQNDNCTLLLRFLNDYKGKAAATCEDSGQVDLALRRPGRFGAELVFVPAEKHERLRLFALVLPLLIAECAAASTYNYTWAELRAARDAVVYELYRQGPSTSGQQVVASALKTVRHAPNWLEMFQIQELPCEGFEEQRARILENFDLYVEFREKCRELEIAPENVLIFGPPQSGKTTLLHCVAKQLAPHFAVFALKAHQILSMYVGESEINVRKLFRLARYQAPSIIVIESVDDLFGSRESANGSTRLITCLLAEIDGAGAAQDVFIIATASSKIDDALTRFGRLGLRVDVDYSGPKSAKKWNFGAEGGENVEQAPL